MDRTDAEGVEDGADDGASDGRDSAAVASGQCVFCRVMVEESGETLDDHYYNTCRMLTQCPDCMQIVEIRSLSAHRVSECLKKDDYAECKKCRFAVKDAEMDRHLLDTQECKRPKARYQKCPLCRTYVGWHCRNA